MKVVTETNRERVLQRRAREGEEGNRLVLLEFEEEKTC